MAGWTNAAEHLKKGDVALSIDGACINRPWAQIYVYVGYVCARGCDVTCRESCSCPHHTYALNPPGHKLQNDKTVPFKDNDFIPFEFLMSYHFVGDFINMEVLRKEVDAVRFGWRVSVWPVTLVTSLGSGIGAW